MPLRLAGAAGLAVPLVALAQDLQGPGFAYYEAGDLDAPGRSARTGHDADGRWRMGAGGLPLVAEAGWQWPRADPARFWQ